MALGDIIKPLLKFTLHPYFRLVRGVTLGVRAVVLEGDNKVLLVRHTYYPGWMFPGGGVEHNQTLEDGLRKELDEEVGVSLRARPELFGVYANFEHFKGDHIALFIVRDWEKIERQCLEIAEYGFFGLDNLPEGITSGTKRRLHEISSCTDPGDQW